MPFGLKSHWEHHCIDALRVLHYMQIEKYLKDAGVEMKDVIRNRIYVINITDWQEVAQAHYEFFSEIKPCCTMIQVSGLINPDMLVEIETEAIID